MEDVTTAPSADSPAVPTFETMSAAETANYLKTGKLPGIETESDAPQGDESGAAPDAATKDSQAKPRESRSERRIRQLAAEVARLKSGQAATPGAAAPAPTAQQVSAATAAAKKEVQLSDFDNFKDYEIALRAEIRQQLKDEVVSAIAAERNQQSQAEKQTQAQKESDKVASTFVERAAEFRKTLREDDFAERLNDVEAATRSPQHFWLANAIADSDSGPELIHYLSDHMEELEELLEVGPVKGLREFGRLEASSKVKLAAPRTKTAAKRITPDVGGSSSSAHMDDLEAIAASGDMKAYMRAMDKREAAERRR
jgi:hypothetical protein